MTSISLRTAAALALLAVAARADAQQSGFRIGATRIVGVNSDNSGINVGGSQVAGSTFAPPNLNAGGGKTEPITNNPSGNTLTLGVPGGTVSVTGLGAAAVTSSFDAVTSQLSAGVVSATTAGGGNVTVSISPEVGRTLAAALSPRAASSQAARDQARADVVAIMKANGVNPTSSVLVVRAFFMLAHLQAAQADVGGPPSAPAPPHVTGPAGGPRARSDQEIPLRKDPVVVAPATELRPGALSPVVVRGPSDQAIYAAAAVNLMSRAISTFLDEQPGTPLPAPLLASALLVRASAQVLPLPASMKQ